MIIRKIARILLLMIGALVVAASSASLSAQNVLTNRYNMVTLGLADGLPHHHVNQILPDDDGFMWISTYGGGAVRYDGYSFTRPLIGQYVAQMSNSCRAMANDSCHRLWVAYEEGTVVVDLHKMSYVTPKFSKQNQQVRLNRPSAMVYCDTKGGIWHLTLDSIFRYTFDEMGEISHVSSCSYRANTPEITLSDIQHDGSVWINIDDGLYRLSESNGKLVRSDIAPSMSTFQGLFVTDLLKHDGIVWISTNVGLYAYTEQDGHLTAYRHTGDSNSLSHDFCTSLAVSPEGQLLVGSLSGVNIMDAVKGTFEHWNTLTTGIPLASDFVTTILVNDGQIWLGTETAGIIRLSPKPFVLHNYFHIPSEVGSLSPHPVNSMYVEPDGTLWVGTVEGGLNRKNADGSFRHWTTANSGLSHNSVSLLTADAHGQLWIGTWGGGLNRLDLSAPDVVKHVDMSPEMSAVTNYIGALAYDKYNDGLWIGSNDGIFFYDLSTQTLEDPFEGNRDIRGCIGAFIDKEGQLWMGCLTGVCIIDLYSRKPSGGGKFRFRRLIYKLDHPESAVVDKICCFCETRDGTLWLGSNGYGLYRRIVDKKSGKESFEVLTTDDGLANNAVKGIIEDDRGRLWITTDNGLSIYNTHTRIFNNYNTDDGLLSRQFYWNSIVRSADGTVYLGSMAGVTEIQGENANARFPIHLTFTRLVVDNQVITSENSDFIDADISKASVIRLHESNKSMTIEFSALNYAGEGHDHYSYRLKGFENEWIPLKSGDHSVRYTNLGPGSYTFEVQYKRGDVVEEPHIISIQIEVAPYFWKSWWFILLSVLLLTLIVVYVYRQRVAYLKRHEAEVLLDPIRKVLAESDNPKQLQTRINNILGNEERYRKSMDKNIEADKKNVLLQQKPFMDRVMEIMEEHYGDSEFGVTEFCEALGMSRSVVSKRLNGETGLSTGQFIRSYRLNIAKEMLVKNTGNRNITEIAYKVGFNDPKYFTRCFTKLYGNSPTNYVDEMS